MKPENDTKASVESDAESVPSRIDPDLLLRFVDGDAQAFGRIFDLLKSDLFYLVRRFFRGAFDQEEALQEIWLKVFRMRAHFDINRHAEFVPWVRAIARNCCIDLLRRRGRVADVPLEDTDAPCEASQGRDTDALQLRQAIFEFVEKLDHEGKQFFQLCFVEEKSHEIIASSMSISVRRSKYLKKKLLARMLTSAALRKMREA